MQKLQVLNNISPNIDGYEKLVSFYQTNNSKFLSTISVSFRNWFSANLCAPLGAILDKLEKDELVSVKFIELPHKIQNILQRNEFLSYYGFERLIDSNHTVIRYLKLQPSDSRYFNDYIAKYLINHHEMPDLSSALKRKITESIYEMFVNAQIHSNTDFIYTCGQFFPAKHSIWFTITDLGIGFKTSVNQRFGSKLSSIQAIQWAIQNGHTTKTKISGGIGLALLKEFISKNCGTMQIISDNGFYSFSHGVESVKELEFEFPGTIITMEFKTDDENSYKLASETVEQGIF
ncbi:MAG: hypothetical protein K2X04_04295 [Burkholderiales bacterium]|nr:hypothetical protein [Burkholderiales bacterium]